MNGRTLCPTRLNEMTKVQTNCAHAKYNIGYPREVCSRSAAFKGMQASLQSKESMPYRAA